jgi:hypothetical protein
MSHDSTETLRGLIGRYEELARIRQALQAGLRHVHISGPPGIGKTTFLRAAFPVNRDPADAIVLVRPSLPIADSQHISAEERETWMSCLVSAVREQHPDLPHTSPGHHWSLQWSELAFALDDYPARVCLLLDDVDRTALWYDEALAHALKAALDHHGHRLTLLTSARSGPTSDLGMPSGASELLGGAWTTNLGPLAPDATARFVSAVCAQESLSLTPAQERRAASWSGGYPALVTLCCRALAHSPALADQDDAESQMEEFRALAHATGLLTRLYDSLSDEERDLLLQKAGFESFLADPSLNHLSFARLVARSIIVPHGKAFRFFSPLFESFVARGRALPVALRQLLGALRPVERAIYLELLAHANQVVARPRLEKTAAGTRDDASASSLDQHVYRLRSVLGALNRGSRMLGVGPKSVRDVGYRLDIEAESVPQLLAAALDYVVE